jgi:signal recognition particle receptor subunit beta
MAEVNPDTGAVNARILYWGPSGSGKSTNLRIIHAKLRTDRRGELREVSTPLDPTVSYEILPIELGEMGGVRTRIQVIAVPGDPSQGPTRKQLLDRVDGVVFVADARREQLDENVASFEELRGSLAAYGRSVEQVPVVVQYNKRDLSDPYTLEELHRKLGTSGAAAFEATASEGMAVLPTLTTISKRVVRSLREVAAAAAAASAAVLERAPGPIPEVSAPLPETPGDDIAEAIALIDEHPEADLVAEVSASAEALFDSPLEALSMDREEEVDATDFVSFGTQVSFEGGLTVESVGAAERVSDDAVRIHLTLRDAGGGTHPVSVTLSFSGSGGDG